MDYASTTPVSLEVLKVMERYMTDDFYNPSAIYMEGVGVKKEIEEGRKKLALHLHVRASEIYFTGSGTESDNLVVLGLLKEVDTPHIVTTKIEHPAILEACREVEERGGKVTYLPVDGDGLVKPSDVHDALTKDTVLVSVMYANNEIGTVQPVAGISRQVAKWKRENGRDVKDAPYVHTDASQAPLYLECDCEKLGVDMMTLDGSKIYGPKGVSVLVKSRYVPLSPILYGGGQERGLRPSTENVPAILGFIKAFELARENMEKESERLLGLREYMIDEILEKISGSKLNGSRDERLPNNVNVCIPNLNAEFAVIQLDQMGVSCASMTACKNLDQDSSSYVVGELDQSCATSSLRFTLGKDTTRKDIDFTIQNLVSVWYNQRNG